MYKSYDMHLNIFWNYNGKPHWENNITKAFINTFETLNKDHQITILNKHLNLGLNNKDNINLSFELQNLKSEMQKKIKESSCNKYLMTLNPSGETWDKEAKKVLDYISQNKDEISNKKLDFKDLTDNQLTKRLKDLNLITEEQIEDKGLIEDVLKTIEIIKNKGGSIPDAWILIDKNDELDTVIAIETKLWDLNPYQNDNHLKKSLGISSSNSKAIKNVKFYDLCESINNIYKKTKITKDFITYMDWLGYYNKFDNFQEEDIELKKRNDNSINILERKWNNFFNYYFESEEYKNLKEDLNISEVDEYNRRIWFEDIDNLNIYFNTYQGEELYKNSGLFVGSEIGVKRKSISKKLGAKINSSDIEDLKEIYNIKTGDFHSSIFKRLHSGQINKYFKYFSSNNLTEAFDVFLSEDHDIYKNGLKKDATKTLIEKLKRKCVLEDKKHIDKILSDVERYKTGKVDENGKAKSYYDLLSYLRFIFYFSYENIIGKNKNDLEELFSEAIRTNHKGLKKIDKILKR